MVYGLSLRAKQALAERGTLSQFCPKRAEPFLHQLMGACVGASFELANQRHGLRYIAREEIFTHIKCPKATRDAINPMAIPMAGIDRTTLIPDDLFRIEYPGEGFRFFAVEIDRNTESIERRSLHQTSFGRKIEGYQHVLHNQRYRSWWGLPNLSILTVTTNATHSRNIVDNV